MLAGTPLFQTKLTYGMICYAMDAALKQAEIKFQTKLTYGMICYNTLQNLNKLITMFQTKLTYGMICYAKIFTSSSKNFQVSN